MDPSRKIILDLKLLQVYAILVRISKILEFLGAFLLLNFHFVYTIVNWFLQTHEFEWVGLMLPQYVFQVV